MVEPIVRKEVERGIPVSLRSSSNVVSGQVGSIIGYNKAQSNFVIRYVGSYIEYNRV
jgi:hypothetical protein